MRRIAIGGFALALTLGAASLASAQQPTPTPGQQPQAQQQQGQRQWGRRAGGWQQGRRQGLRALFRGITLTDQQKQQIRTINQKYATQSRSIREAMRPAMQEARAARQKGDTTAARAVFQRTKPQRDQLQQLHEQQVREVRAVLTADQQKVFDQNAAQLKQRLEQRRQRGMQRQRVGA